MFYQKFTSVILIVLCFSFFFLQTNLQSQTNQNRIPSKVNVTMFASEDGYTDLELSVMNTFKEVLKENGLLSENDNDIELLLNVKKINDDDNKIILSIVEMGVIPDEVVEAGKKAEIFYSVLDDTKKSNLPNEGKFIREYVSSEYMKQFRMIWSNSLEIIDIIDLENYCRKLVNKYL